MMRGHRVVAVAMMIFGLRMGAFPISKPHIVALGKWTSVQWIPGNGADQKPLPLKVRPLLVDTRVKEFTFGPAHDVTERLFVVRRAFRVNDSLPQESDALPRWQWQRGGWLLIDRISSRVSAINLPEFDVFYSAANWYRDYAAYCGVSADGKKVYAMVAQIGRRKPLLKKLLEGSNVVDDMPDSACPAPAWQRNPARVTFEPVGVAKQSFSIRGRVVDLVADDEEDDEDSSK